MTQALPPMPPNIARLPRDHRGFPVPWFVTWFNGGQPCDPGEGVPDFRIADASKIADAIKRHLCWTCGGKLGVFKAFVIGPMCAINRVISEPPSHRDCAVFSACACPFLSRPRMRRNENDLPDDRVAPAGIGLARNPGAVCIWITKTYRPFRAPGGILFSLGDPVEVMWFANGDTATRADVLTSIASGLPTLAKMAETEGQRAVDELSRQLSRAMKLVPA